MSGHRLITKNRDRISFESLSTGGDVVEIGTARPAEGLPYNESSTHDLSLLARSLGRRFVSIDLARERMIFLEEPDIFIQGDGLEVLKSWSAPIFLMYLDNFDVINDPEHEEHLRNRIGRFYEEHGLILSNEQSAYAHAAQARAALDHVLPGGFICLDDTIFDYRKDRWWGKGATAVPYLLRMGCVIIDIGQRGVLLQKLGPSAQGSLGVTEAELLACASFGRSPLSV